MNVKLSRVLLLLAALAVLVSCAKTDSGTAAGSTASKEQAVTYETPDKMLAQLQLGGFQCVWDGEPATYNVFGALSLYCRHGTPVEAIYLDVYPNERKLADAKEQLEARGDVVGFGHLWGASAQSQKTLDELMKILMHPSG